MNDCSKSNEIMQKPPFAYYGGKQLLAKRIINLIPKHTAYIEPFCGGAAIFFAKEPSKVEILNDTNRELINFYKILKRDFVSLEKEVQISLHSRDLHRKAYVIYNNPDLFTELQRAWAIYILSTQGFGGMISNTWGYDRKDNKTVKTIHNKKERFTYEYAIRMQNVQLESTDAIRVIKSRDFEDAFHYVDPPYYNSDMGHYDGYTIEDFQMLLNALSEVKGKFLLSSYPSDILKKYTKQFGWYQIEIDKRVSISKKGKRKTEVLTANYKIE